jgi:hypothetical protein
MPQPDLCPLSELAEHDTIFTQRQIERGGDKEEMNFLALRLPDLCGREAVLV